MVHKVEEEIKEQPNMLTGGKLKPYQLLGLQWLVSLYNNRLNGILADEMGLGKTIQTISLVCYLMEKKNNFGPYLVVVPLSTLANWVIEFAKWAPDVITYTFKGAPKVRKALYTNYLQHGKFNVVLTTYEYIMRDKSMLGKIKWNYIIIDEGHRMKNHSCKLVNTFTKFYNSRHRLLLTGTPLQNSLPELWSLLNFLLPSIFNSMDNFEEWFNAPFANAGEKVEMTEEETLLIIHRLHEVLRPFLLRRLKKEVEHELPDKIEVVLKCGLSAWQAKMYEEMYKTGGLRVASNSNPSNANSTNNSLTNVDTENIKVKALKNTVMQLRKICNHPFLFENEWNIDESLIRSAGKFVVLDSMLPKLKACGHRVLIFSQMTNLITILEDYFQLKNYQYLRLDGATKAEDRATLLAQFNAPNSPYFIFVLSTRAGGLGLNLQTADTVILFDSDWNPHVDLQALDRAHRIGQTREVRVFRLVTIGTIEETILARANFKMSLDQKIIEAGKFNRKSDANERKTMLQELLASDHIDSYDKKNDMVVNDEEVNQLLARSDEEFIIFQNMDLERKNKDEILWKKKGGKGNPPPRLMSIEELPDWMVCEQPVDDKLSREKYGRGRRTRTDVSYDDGLTEQQFDLLCEKGGDDDQVKIWKEENLKKRIKKRSDVVSKEDDEEFELDDKKPSSSSSSSSKPRGRKRKVSKESSSSTSTTSTTTGTGRGRGRGRGKAKIEVTLDDEEDAKGDGRRKLRARRSSSSSKDPEIKEPLPKRRRTSSIKDDSPSSSTPSNPAGRGKRGRPRRNSSVSDPVVDDLKKKLLDVWNAVRKDKEMDTGRIRSQLFLKLPSAKIYADYYQIIQNPIDMTIIKQRINSGHYKSSADAKNDFVLLWSNAQIYNMTGSAIYEDAVHLQSLSITEFKRLFEGAEAEKGPAVKKQKTK